jgi:hypothetical protein
MQRFFCPHGGAQTVGGPLAPDSGEGAGGKKAASLDGFAPIGQGPLDSPFRPLSRDSNNLRTTMET